MRTPAQAAVAPELVAVFREQIQASYREREVLVQHVLSITAKLIEQERIWVDRYAELAAQHGTLQQEHGRSVEMRTQLTATISELQAEIAEAGRAVDAQAAGIANRDAQIAALANFLAAAERAEAQDESQSAAKVDELRTGLEQLARDRDSQVEELRRRLAQTETERAEAIENHGRVEGRLSEIERHAARGIQNLEQEVAALATVNATRNDSGGERGG